jgi:uncharacterized protein (TIGR03083 family)
MNPEYNPEYIASIQSDSDRIVSALASSPDAEIPWCGDWTVKDCAHHVGALHHVVAAVIKGRPTANFGLFKTLDPPSATDPALGPWIAAGTATLVEELRTAYIDEPCWTFWSEVPTVAFWSRRSAHETAVHRWDVERAAGVDIDPMDPVIAADGVDEFLDVFVGMMRGLHATPGAGETVHVHCTDTAGEWLLTLPDTGTRTLTREHAKGDVAFRGPAEGLLLYLWGRLPADAAGVEIVGDAAFAATWRDLVPAI